MAWTQRTVQRGRDERRRDRNDIDGGSAPRQFTNQASDRSWGWWGVVRTVVAVLLALAGALGLIAGVALHWLHNSVVDRDGFAQISQDLALDQSLQDELVSNAKERAAATVQEQDLGEMPFGGSLLGIVEQRVTSGIEDYAQSDQYLDDWNQVALGTHELNLEPAGTANGQGAPDDLEIYAGPVVDSVEEHIEDRIGFDVDLDLRSEESLGGEDGIIVVTDSMTGPAFNAMADYAAQAPLFTWGGVIALGLALLLARHREWVLLGGGAGLIIGALYVQGAGVQLADSVRSSPSLDGVGRSVVERMFELLLADMNGVLTPWLWGGVIAVVAGALLAVARILWGWGSGGRGYSPAGSRRRVIEI